MTGQLQAQLVARGAYEGEKMVAVAAAEGEAADSVEQCLAGAAAVEGETLAWDTAADT